MLRIFRGERHVEGAAQPGQREQDADAQAEADATAESSTPPQPGNGHSTLAMQDLGAPAEPSTSVEPSPAGQSPTEGPSGQSPVHSAPEARAEEPAQRQPGFLDRGRMRRRSRFLRAARELAYRDLGGLVFDLHRYGQRNDDIVHAKLDTLARIDSELRTLESALQERSPVTVLREAGVAACPRCAAIHGSGDRFCPTCGLSVDQAERPIAAPNIAPTSPAPGVGWPPPDPRPGQPRPGAPAGTPAPLQAGAPVPASVPLPPVQSAPTAAPPPPARRRPRAGSATERAEAGADALQQTTPQHTRDLPDIPQSPDSDAAHAALPAAPAVARRASDPPTEVIRSGLGSGGSPERTVAFDPISSLGSDSEGAEDRDRGQDQR